MLLYGMDDGSADSLIQCFQVQRPVGSGHGVGGSKQLFMTDEEVAKPPHRVFSMCGHFLVVMNSVMGMSIGDNDNVGDFGKQVPSFKVSDHPFACKSSDLIKDFFLDDGVDWGSIKNFTVTRIVGVLCFSAFEQGRKCGNIFSVINDAKAC